MQLILREGGRQSLTRLYLLLEANLIYSSIHLLHSNFSALLGHFPTSQGTSFGTNILRKSQGTPEDHVVILWQCDHCNAVGPGTSFEAGYGFMLPLVA